MSGLALPAARLVRLPLACAVAGLVAGLLALGGGLRLAMRVVALLNADTFVFTENGNLVGEITLEGTVFLVVAGGMVGTLLGLGYGVARSWLPWRGWARGTLYGALLAIAFGSPLLVSGESLDFALLEGDLQAIALLLACPVLFGTLLGVAVDRLAPVEPAVLRRTGIRLAGTLLVAVLTLAGLVRLTQALAEIL